VLDFDKSLTWKAMEERLARTDSPRERKMLSIVIAHQKAEAARDIPRVLDTLSPDPDLHIWHDGVDIGPKGIARVRSFYERLMSSGGGVVESVKERIVVDHDTVVHEGTVRSIIPGSLAKRQGYDVDDENAVYLVSYRLVVFWPFDEEGRSLGEDSYYSGAKEARKLAPEDVPDSYRAAVSS
jgi:hypothetical protein